MSKAKGIEFTTETITPKKAEKWLSNGRPDNRNVSKAHVAKLSRDMEAGNWPLTADSIKFNTKNQLIDGRHRLRACIKAGVPFTTVVARNVDDAAFESFDQGKNRTAGDILSIRGEKESHRVLSGALKYVWQFDNGILAQTGAGTTPTTNERLETLERHPKLRDSVGVGKDLQGIATPSIGAALHYIFSIASEQLSDEFFEGLVNGLGLQENSPIWTLREKLLRERSRANRGQIHYRTQMAWIIKAWNAFYEGTEIKMLRFLKGESFPEIAGLEKL